MNSAALRQIVDDVSSSEDEDQFEDALEELPSSAMDLEDDSSYALFSGALRNMAETITEDHDPALNLTYSMPGQWVSKRESPPAYGARNTRLSSKVSESSVETSRPGSAIENMRSTSPESEDSEVASRPASLIQHPQSSTPVFERSNSVEDGDLFAATFGQRVSRDSSKSSHGSDDSDDNNSVNSDKSQISDPSTSIATTNQLLDEAAVRQVVREADTPLTNATPKPAQTPSQSPSPLPPSQPLPQPPTENLFLRTLATQGYVFTPCSHIHRCSCNLIQPLDPAPPRAATYQPASHPTLPKAMSSTLAAHERFHSNARLLLPSLLTRDNFDMSRRYLIAVLFQGKDPKKSRSEKDFLWMKGNRYSTVETVWHTYQTRTMADPDELVLLLGREAVDKRDQMQQLDYFGDRFVVFRALSRGDAGAKGRSLIEAVVPELVELDD